MAKQYDFKKEWPKIKKQLSEISNELSKEALVLAKKGNVQLKKFSKQSKLHLDLKAIALKREHLHRLLGKAYVKAGFPGDHNQEMKKCIDELKKIDKEEVALQKKLKVSEEKGRTPKKKTTRKTSRL